LRQSIHSPGNHPIRPSQLDRLLSPRDSASACGPHRHWGGFGIPTRPRETPWPPSYLCPSCHEVMTLKFSSGMTPVEASRWLPNQALNGNKPRCVAGKGVLALRGINLIEREMCSYLKWLSPTAPTPFAHGASPSPSSSISSSTTCISPRKTSLSFQPHRLHIPPRPQRRPPESVAMPFVQRRNDTRTRH
jgi:hypothetical protein